MLLIADIESLAGREGGLETLFELWVAIKRLLTNVKVESAVDKKKGLGGVKQPKISVPTFDGQVLIGRAFGNNLMPSFIARLDWITLKN